MKFEREKYDLFEKKAQKICPDRVHISQILRHAYSIDASCYRYIPQIVIVLHSEQEAIALLKLANELNIQLTFKAAGSSLSGQCSSDRVLIMVNDRFKSIKVLDNGLRIELEPGVVANDANIALKPYHRKIGPDPATITAALIGGVINNNSSGMCCGVSQNSYQTIDSLRAVLLDGTVVDTADPKSVEQFERSHPDLIAGLFRLRNIILNDDELIGLITRKYKIKNTTGYSLNSLLDFSEIKDIFNHILIGSEGTLAFLSKVRLKTVPDYSFKASGLFFYENLDHAMQAVLALIELNQSQSQPLVQSAELMDYACLHAVSKLDDVKSIVADIKEGNCALLIQAEAETQDELDHHLTQIKTQLKDCPNLTSSFSSDETMTAKWWKIRKGILPIVAGLRAPDQTIITEDVCFESDKLADGIKMLQYLFKKYHFEDGVIFGHALAGNLHFNITPNLNDPIQQENFANLVKEMGEKVVELKGSQKAEHGTGRMVAAFVELEWGKKAYLINCEIKDLFDPKRLLNPDVIITNDPDIYKKNLKKMPKTIFDLPPEQEVINQCMECGFCEKHCPSRNLTLTPRQRIAILRDVQMYLDLGQQEQADQLLKEYHYYGNETCAACSQCLELCPLGIDTAKIALHLRKQAASHHEKSIEKIYTKLSNLIQMTKVGLNVYGFGQAILGAKNVAATTKVMRKITRAIPYTPIYMPKANRYHLTTKENGSDKVIYFTACMNRIFKPNAKFKDQRSLQAVIESICQKAQVSILYPEKLSSMCCGKLFENSDKATNENYQFLFQQLDELSEHGKYPIMIDHSSCSYQLLQTFSKLYPQFTILDVNEFLYGLTDRLTIEKTNKKVLIHKLCLLKKMKKDHFILELAKVCSENVKVIESFACCGFSGDKGFFTPELNQSSTQYLKEEAESFDIGVSSSSTCEIGLSSYSSVQFQNIAYLLDHVSK